MRWWRKGGWEKSRQNGTTFLEVGNGCDCRTRGWENGNKSGCLKLKRRIGGRKDYPKSHRIGGESETREWRRKIREEKEAISREREARQAWHLEKLRKMGCFLDLGVNPQERETRPGDGWEMKRPSRF